MLPVISVALSQKVTFILKFSNMIYYNTLYTNVLLQNRILFQGHLKTSKLLDINNQSLLLLSG